jgi:hypothetical protein
VPKLIESRILLIITLIAILACVGITGYALGARKLGPVQVIANYDLNTLIADANTMNECADCHEAKDFHSCETCHDDHGAIELAEVPFFAMVELSGDVPNPGFVLLDDILPYSEQHHTHVLLQDFLAGQGIDDFESVTLTSPDGGFITIQKDQLTRNALLLPYEDGIRFASEDLHVSTWLKGIRGFIVVGKNKSLLINGEATSMGRLLLGPTESITIEQADVMLKSEEDGEIRKATTASRIEGIPIGRLFDNISFQTLKILDKVGKIHTLTFNEVETAILAPIQGELSLVIPERGRSQWIEGVQSLETEE